MPRKAKKADTSTVHEDISSNGISAKKLKGFFAEVEQEQAAIDEIMVKAVQACQPHRDQQKEIIKAAAEAGVPKKVFKAKLNERRFLTKAELADSALSDEQKEIFAQVSLKLGPLGEWAKANFEAGA